MEKERNIAKENKEKEGVRYQADSQLCIQVMNHNKAIASHTHTAVKRCEADFANHTQC
jgi:hypothetical protein